MTTTILNGVKHLDHLERQAATSRALLQLQAPEAGQPDQARIQQLRTGADMGVICAASCVQSACDGAASCPGQACRLAGEVGASISAQMAFARQVAANALPADVTRCDGASDALGVCPERDTCRRYTEPRQSAGMQTPFTHWACFAGRDLKIEVQS